MLTATAPQHLDQVFPMLCEPKRRYSLNYSSFTTAQCARFKFILSLGSGIRKRTFKNTGWSAHSAAEKNTIQALIHFVVQGNFKECFQEYRPKIPYSIIQKLAGCAKTFIFLLM